MESALVRTIGELHMLVLAVVAGRPLARPDEIARDLDLAVGDVVRLIGDLEAVGYVSRLPIQ